MGRYINGLIGLLLAGLAVGMINYSGKHLKYQKHLGNHVIVTDLFKDSSFTPGPFIVVTGNKELRLNYECYDRYKHECGHVEQFKDLGIIYYPAVALPSVFNHCFLGDDNFYTETWANELAEEKYGEFSDKKRYPIAKK
jgi:hypothetical protein